MRASASVLHLDLDAFFASVEQRDKPSLAGRPVVVGGVGGRGVVATASYEARALGVHSAMGTGQARHLAPHAAYLATRFEAYRESSRIVMALLGELSPLVEPLSIDEAFVDLAAGGVPHSVGPEPLGMSTGEFEVMYLLEATAVQAGQLRRDLERIGDSVGVVGTPDALGVGLYQVHVHTDTPRAALPHAGRARQICIHHLHPTALVSPTDEPPSPWEAFDSDPTGHVVSFERLAARRAERKAQSVRMHPSQAAAPRPAPAQAPHLAVRSRQSGVGVIACTRAPGLIEQLARSDAAVVLNPDREGIARAAADLGSSQVIVLPCDAACTEAAHDAARFLAARSAVSTVRPPVGTTRKTGAARETARAGVASERYEAEGIQLLVCDTDDEARVLAAAVALAGRGEEAELAELARRAWSAAAGLRTIALNGAQADGEAVARAVASALRPSDELLTVITGRNAGRDVGALAASAAVGARGHVVGEDVEVAVHAGGQEHPDVLIAIE